MSIPNEQLALKITKDQQHLELKTIPVDDDIKPTQILVKNKASAVEVVDTYFLANKWGLEGAGAGIAVAGDVVKVGSEVTRFKVGDTVAACLFGTDADHPENGGYQQYTKVYESNTYGFELKVAEGDEIPEGPITTYEGAVSFISTLVTTGLGVYHNLGAGTSVGKKTLLIYGGSTITGRFSLQYAHYIGWRVIAIASAKHHEYLKSLGADVVLDYHTDDLTQDIKNLHEDIDLVYITHGGQFAINEIHKALPTDKPIKVETLQGGDFSFTDDPKPNVEYGFTRAFTAHGEVIHYADGSDYHPRPGTLQSLKKWWKVVDELNSKGLVTHNPVKVLPDGLNSVNEGLKIVSSKSTTTRLVVRP